ncbi:hypothetical protein CHCC15543_2517 [Bacillus licheniformis]|nr:hypothetical protein CHCC15543_2517 [Bacillus licheniformis]
MRSSGIFPETDAFCTALFLNLTICNFFTAARHDPERFFFIV